MKPLIVGEVNPYGSDPAYALFPLPKGASGFRLSNILGLPLAEYLRYFDRVNLCTGRWSMRTARAEAARILAENRIVIMLGRRVAEAFGLRSVAPFTACYGESGGYVLLPHPSGRCRVWNEPRNVERARRLVMEAIR